MSAWLKEVSCARICACHQYHQNTAYLLLRPHSTVELIDRAEAAGLVERTPDLEDGRLVRVRLSRRGEKILSNLTRAHLARLHDLAAVLDELVTSAYGQDDRPTLPCPAS